MSHPAATAAAHHTPEQRARMLNSLRLSLATTAGEIRQAETDAADAALGMATDPRVAATFDKRSGDVARLKAREDVLRRQIDAVAGEVAADQRAATADDRAAAAKTARQLAVRRIAAVQAAVGTLNLFLQQAAAVEGLNEQCRAAAIEAADEFIDRSDPFAMNSFVGKTRLKVPLFESLKTAVTDHSRDVDPVTQAQRASDVLASTIARIHARAGEAV